MLKIAKRKTIPITITTIIGVALLVTAGLGLWDYFHTTHDGDDYPSTQTVIKETAVSEKQITVSDAGYEVPANQPRTIEIPSINSKGYIQKIGVYADGAMATPNNINFGGWYTKGAIPGDVGLSIVNGHAGGRYATGIFKYLGNVKKEDLIRIQMGDLSWREFSVSSVGTYNVADAATPLFKDDESISKELHLITCDGVFDDKTQTYDQRTIVVAKLKES